MRQPLSQSTVWRQGGIGVGGVPQVRRRGGSWACSFVTRGVTLKGQFASAGAGPGPGCGTGTRSGAVGPRSLVMPPGRYQFAPQSLGWTRVCGTERSGVWVLKNDSRTDIPENLDDVRGRQDRQVRL